MTLPAGPVLLLLAPIGLACGPGTGVPVVPVVPVGSVVQEESRPAPARTNEWPQWRGPLGTGFAPDGEPPLEWSETRNVLWKTPVPGKGHSSPVVAGGRVFLTTAVPHGEPVPPRPEAAPGAHDNVAVTQRYRSVALALDLETGRPLWERVLHEGFPAEGGHATGSYASGSPVTDGERVFVFFGSQGLHGLSSEGEVLWSRDLGDMRTKHGHGEGASPALHGDTLIVNWDDEGASFVVGLDAATGATRWRTERDEVTSWASPIVAEVDGEPQAIVAGTNRIRGYDLATGAVLWECGGLSHNVVATPLVHEGVLVAASSYEKQAMLAIALSGATGDLTGTDHVLWYRRRSTPYVPSPLLVGETVYVLQHYQGIVTRVDLRTGAEPHRALRLDGIRDVYASPVAAAGRVYVTDRSGVTVVLSHEPEPRVLARNTLDDRLSASAAIVGTKLLLRGEGSVYCLAEQLLR